MTDQRDEIRARIDIVALVGRQVALKKAGKDWKGLCPFHPDKNPSFNVSPRTQTYRCWSCGEKGDIFDWVMKTENVEFREALQILAKYAGVELRERNPGERSAKLKMQAAMEEALAFFSEALSKSSQARAYCDERGLDHDVRARWELGYAPEVGDALANHLKRKGFVLAECKSLFLVEPDSTGGYYDKFRGRLMFPIRDERGDLVAFGGRVLGDGLPKYINSSDTPIYRKSRVLYGLFQSKDAISKARRAVLVEGYLDAIACHRAGVPTAIASLGTAMSEDHAKLLKRWCDEVSVLYDADEAGQKAAARAAEILAPEGLRVRIALMPKGQDPDTLLRQAGASAVRKSVENAVSPVEFRIKSIKERLGPDDDDYWQEVVAALATAANPIELDSFIVQLAAEYPGTRDSAQAQMSLRAWVARTRKAANKPGPLRASAAVAMQPRQTTSMLSQEAAIFRCLFEPDLARQAWEILEEPEILETGFAEEVLKELKQTFGAAPQGEPRVWLPRLEPEHIREALIAIAESDHLMVSEEVLADAAAGLRKRRDRREIHTLKQGELSSERLAAIAEKLRSLGRNSGHL